MRHRRHNTLSESPPLGVIDIPPHVGRSPGGPGWPEGVRAHRGERTRHVMSNRIGLQGASGD